MNEYDIIHVHDLYPSIVYDMLLKDNAILHVATIHAMTPQEHTMIDALRRYVYKNFQGVIYVSKQLHDDCVER